MVRFHGIFLLLQSSYGNRQGFTGLYSELLEGFRPADQAALARCQPFSCHLPGLFCLIQAEADIFKGLDKADKFII